MELAPGGWLAGADPDDEELEELEGVLVELELEAAWADSVVPRTAPLARPTVTSPADAQSLGLVRIWSLIDIVGAFLSAPAVAEAEPDSPSPVWAHPCQRLGKGWEFQALAPSGTDRSTRRPRGGA
jgi:hypothetical protein